MKHNPEKYLKDAFDSCVLLLAYKETIKSFSDFSQSSTLIKDGILRRLSIIGEALFQANKLNKEIKVTDIRKIIGLRHIIVHDYDKLDDHMIYQILMNNIAPLKNELGAILSK
jgi:uncharacterized protein with HEPN domain